MSYPFIMETFEFYEKEWELSHPQKIAETPSSVIFFVGSEFGPAVIKLLKPLGKKDEGPGAYFLNACAGQGAAHIYRYDEGAYLIERLSGENLYQYSKANCEEKASQVFVEIIKEIRTAKPPSQLPRYNELFDFFKKVEFPKEHGELLTAAQEVCDDLLKTQQEEVLLHGDLHHENILKRTNGEFVCFDPKGFVGDPCYELGTTLKNPWDYPSISQDLENFEKRLSFFSKELGYPQERIRKFVFVHCCLSVCWAIEDQDDFGHSLAVARMIYPTIN